MVNKLSLVGSWCDILAIQFDAALTRENRSRTPEPLASQQGRKRSRATVDWGVYFSLRTITRTDPQVPEALTGWESTRVGRSMRKWVEVRPTSTKPFRR